VYTKDLNIEVGMNIEFSTTTNPRVFEAFVRVITFIVEKYGTSNSREIINLIQQDYGVRLITRDNSPLFTAHFANERAYV
jgi:hypothetical protein